MNIYAWLGDRQLGHPQVTLVTGGSFCINPDAARWMTLPVKQKIESVGALNFADAVV